MRVIESTALAEVAVNGGADTANAGTSCLKTTTGVDAACTGGYVAIQSNNKQLLAATLQAKASAATVRLYYAIDGGPFHCPGLVFTPCSAISVTLK